MKPLAFCGGCGGLYLYSMGIQWPFRHFIASGTPKCRFFLNKCFSTVRILSSTVVRAEEILIRIKKPPYEHAVASAAERLRPNPDYAHFLAGRIGGSFDSQIQRKKRAFLCSTYILGSLTATEHSTNRVESCNNRNEEPEKRKAGCTDGQ